MVALLAGCSSDDTEVKLPETTSGACPHAEEAPLPAPALHTARWAFEPWISKDISDRADTYAFVDGFRDRGIPVGAVVLDSPWETHYNTFVPNPTRYGDFPGLVRDMHDRGVRVVLWITSLVNETGIDFEPNGDRYDGPSPNLEEGLRCNYFVQDGESFVWWKGKGASVDFFNAKARSWWHAQQDGVLDAGIDGWKLDFGESYVRLPTLKTAEGERSHQAYSEKYYEDFLAYGQSRRGRDFVTMVRAWDASYDIPGRFYAKREHAPVAWMGDNRRDWFGLADSLDHMFVSAREGYPVLGADIGGYLDRDDLNLLGPPIPFDSLNFARWIAVGAMSPFMQLHGRANLEPWSVPDNADETVAVYRYWATLHHALVPFFYSLAEEAWVVGGSTVHPIGEPSEWPGDYRYMLGDAFLVAPILDETGARSVALPAGARWFDWWTGEAIAGGTTVTRDYSADRRRIPLFVREGAIVPMDVDADVIGFGGAAAKGARTILAWPGPTPTQFRLREDDDAVTVVTARELVDGSEVTVASAPKPLLLRIRSELAPAEVREDGAPLAQSTLAAIEGGAAGWVYAPEAKTVVVRLPAHRGPSTVTTKIP